ncbi:MAG: AMP-binding protein [Muribaculaceae bacterium]|nr:AMP-binding protein [Muribaculaceae bacterium]
MDFKEFIEEWTSSGDYIKVHTSGSTGNPKDIFLPKYFVEESAKRTNRFFNISSESWLHSCIGPDYIGGKMMAVRANIANARFTFELPSNEPLQELSPQDNLDLVAIVPSQVIYMLDNIKSIPKIQNLLIGGSPVHPSLRQKIAKSGLNAYESYGMTETASHIALRKITYDETPFKLLPGINISLDNDNCLVINFEDKNKIYTNDIAELISDSEFYIRGRKDQIIITGGKKINPVELEIRISKFIESPFIFIGVPDEKWGEKVVLLIEGEKKENLKNNLKLLLHNWEMPKDIFFVKELPRTPNGKIKRFRDLSSLSFFAHDSNLSFSMQNRQEL